MASHLDWPFFDPSHRALSSELREWAASNLNNIDHHDADRTCRQLAGAIGRAGLFRYSVGGKAFGGEFEGIDTRSICLVRETMAEFDGLADFVCAMQGLGSGAITLEGTPQQKEQYLTGVAKGELIAAFALTEPDSGSDVAAMQLEARRDGDAYILNGQKTWISNGGIADFYVVFARTGEAPGARGISAFVVEAGTPGLDDSQRLEVIAPHPLSTLTFTECRVPASALLGAPAQGFKLAMRTLDIFRTSVAAAALGFARRALCEATNRTLSRQMFGGTLSQQPLAQAMLADMATMVDRSALLTYRAAWLRDTAENVTKEAAMAKLTATEDAQRVIDMAVQLFGGAGVQVGNIVESLYREIRALRIYEGATEVQKLIIARELLKEARA